MPFLLRPIFMSDAQNSDALFSRCANAVQQLQSALPTLEQAAEMLLVSPRAGREWYEVLRQKLAPQLGDRAYLVAAVVGNLARTIPPFMERLTSMTWTARFGFGLTSATDAIILLLRCC